MLLRVLLLRVLLLRVLLLRVLLLRILLLLWIIALWRLRYVRAAVPAEVFVLTYGVTASRTVHKSHPFFQHNLNYYTTLPSVRASGAARDRKINGGRLSGPPDYGRAGDLLFLYFPVFVLLLVFPAAFVEFYYGFDSAAKPGERKQRARDQVAALRRQLPLHREGLAQANNSDA